jgi:hypothetical protein
MVSVARGRQFLEGITHGDERRDLGIDFCDMVERQALDVGAGTAFVMPEIKKPPDALDRETEITGAPDEAQYADIGFSVNSVAAFAADGGYDQADDFIIPDGLGGRRKFWPLARCSQRCLTRCAQRQVTAPYGKMGLPVTRRSRW